LSDSVLKLGPPANNTFPLLDFFTPFDQGGPGDSDVGSAGLILFPATSSGAQMLVQQGKQGTIYLVNRNNLGKDCATQSTPCTTTDMQIPQELRGATPGVLSSPLYWNGNVYWPSYSNLFAWSVDPASGLLSSSPTSQSAQTFARTAGASLSASGTTNGIVWILQNTGELFGVRRHQSGERPVDERPGGEWPRSNRLVREVRAPDHCQRQGLCRDRG
jgi:hypothetical protein